MLNRGTGMLTTGNQLKAARALIGIEQQETAAAAGVHVNTIRSMEAAGSSPIAGRSQNVQAVQRALEATGIEFLNHGSPGVRLRTKS
jgi:transcriptional regulator with XRE-family HTH domain